MARATDGRWPYSQQVQANRSRCPWGDSSDLMRAYHDTEWGVPLRDSRGLFELLCLEGAQAGLAWITVLRKRTTYRAAFADFAPERVSQFSHQDRKRLIADPGIIRNRAKIEAIIGNARAWLAVDDPVSLIWSFVDGAPIVNRWSSQDQVPASTAQSRAMSAALRAHGFRFVGPTITYAFMQSAGLVNDHLISCFRHAAVSGAPHA